MPDILSKESVRDILSFYGWYIHDEDSLVSFTSHPEIEDPRSFFALYSTEITCMYQGIIVPEIKEVVYEQLSIDRLRYWIERLIKEG